MTKKNNTNQNTPKPANESFSDERFIQKETFDSFEKSLPSGGKNDVTTIMQRTATPPMPDSGDTKKQ